MQKDVTLQLPSPITREQECINRKRQERRSHLIVGGRRKMPPRRSILDGLWEQGRCS